MHTQFKHTHAHNVSIYRHVQALYTHTDMGTCMGGGRTWVEIVFARQSPHWFPTLKINQTDGAGVAYGYGS